MLLQVLLLNIHFSFTETLCQRLGCVLNGKSPASTCLLIEAMADLSWVLDPCIHNNTRASCRTEPGLNFYAEDTAVSIDLFYFFAQDRKWRKISPNGGNNMSLSGSINIPSASSSP